MKVYILKTRYSYVVAQLTGWITYISFAFLLNQLNGYGISVHLLLGLSVAFFVGIGITHGYRELILQLNWLTLAITRLFPRLLVTSLILGFVFELLYLQFNYLLGNSDGFVLSKNVQEIFGWVVIIFLWSTIYFGYYYFRNYKKEEIKNLRLEASKAEIELSNLKSQLNPHFIFNAMNSIRALIDEDPKKAKNAVTQLSNVLRLSLQSGKRKLVSLETELQLVKSYLSIEKARFEERLQIKFDLDEDCMSFEIPPLMLQTLCENAIKHGISKLSKGGEVVISSSLLDGNFVKIAVLNTGKLIDTGPEDSTGIGIENTKERLKLVYGKRAEFKIFQYTENQVCSEIMIESNK